MSRPSTYNEKIADIICEAIATGSALHVLCREKDMPGEKTVYQWLERHEEFAQKYARARARQQDYEADNMVIIADTAKDANIARLQIDTRKWRASKLAPKKYGDKQIVDVNQTSNFDDLTSKQLTELATLLRKPPENTSGS